MSVEPLFLTVEQVILLHQQVIERYGGDPTVLSRDLLESAVMMPQARFGGEFLHGGLAAMAAAYLFHLCKNHSFLDGNKRTALAAAEVFLLGNEKRLNATNRELERLTLRVAEGSMSKEELTLFFEERVMEVE
jgi:death-on-curing protein